MDAVVAVVARQLGSCDLETLHPRPLGARDVLVGITASGLCHSDISALDGTLAAKPPFVLGHEGAGEVLAVGPEVTSVAVGDRVVLNAIPTCGACPACSRGQATLCERSNRLRRPGFLDRGGVALYGLSGLGTFAGAVTLHEAAVTAVRTDLPAEQLALLGCAVLTGAGAVLNTAGVVAGDAVGVIGAGGVGLAAVQAARLAGAQPIVAIEPGDAARAIATRCGATHSYSPTDATAEQIRELHRGRLLDVVIDCVGTAATVQHAWDLTRRGATIVAVGVGPRSAHVPVPLVEFALTGKRLVGCVYGDSSVGRDIGRYVALAEAGQLNLELLLGRRVTMDQVPAALQNPGNVPGRVVMVP